MRKSAIAAGLTAVGTGIALTMTAVSPALAGPVSVRGITTQIVTVAATAPAGDTGEAEATCGAGELLLGGGYVVNSAFSDWRVYVDAPLNGMTWLVEPVNFDAQPLSFSAYAICATSAPGQNAVSNYTTQVVDSQVSAPANDVAEADAACPAGDLLTGGGYDVFNVSANWSVYLNGPTSPGTWTAEIDNEVPLATTFDSFAVCLGRVNSKPITNMTVSTVDSPATAQGNSVQTADVSCGAHELMVGGGHEIDSIGQDWNIQASAPVSQNDWQVQVANLDSFSRDFDSIAMCLAKS